MDMPTMDHRGAEFANLTLEILSGLKQVFKTSADVVIYPASGTGAWEAALGSAHPLAAPYQALQTADGWINIGAANQANWLRLVDVIGMPELAEDLRFKDNAERMKNLPPLIEVLTNSFKQRSTADWLTRLETVGVPAGPVLSIGDMLKDPQVLAREMVKEVRIYA